MISCTQPTSQQTSQPANLRTARVDDIAKKEDDDDIDQLVHEKDGYNGDDERKDEDGDDHLNKNNHENDGDVVGDDISDELLATKGLPIRLMMILIPPVWWTTTDGIFNQKNKVSTQVLRGHLSLLIARHRKIQKISKIVAFVLIVEFTHMQRYSGLEFVLLISPQIPLPTLHLNHDQLLTGCWVENRRRCMEVCELKSFNIYSGSD